MALTGGDIKRVQTSDLIRAEGGGRAHYIGKELKYEFIGPDNFVEVHPLVANLRNLELPCREDT